MALEMKAHTAELLRTVVVWRRPGARGPAVREVFGPYKRRGDARRRLRFYTGSPYYEVEEARVESTGPIEWQEVPDA